jgi:hypothetical protein
MGELISLSCFELFSSFIFTHFCLYNRFLSIFKYLFFGFIDGVFMTETVMLKVSKKGDKGFQVCSVPLQKLKRVASLKHRFWSLEGDFLVLHSYGDVVVR